MIGNRPGAEETYRFARGEEVRSSTGQRVRLIRPLDFLVVSDHADLVYTGRKGAIQLRLQ